MYPLPMVIMPPRVEVETDLVIGRDAHMRQMSRKLTEAQKQLEEESKKQEEEALQQLQAAGEERKDGGLAAAKNGGRASWPLRRDKVDVLVMELEFDAASIDHSLSIASFNRLLQLNEM